ncbi:MAG: CRISPR-associated protein Cas4 [Hungateiclostridium thermocellum]|nr:CRISPR-associated protein Cas4 [Acetivibrio thermocellus]
MKAFNEDEYLNLAGIQHYAFCPRQWALIHIEKQWQDNLRTVEGELLHKTAHDGQAFEKRGDILISRGMPVFSTSLGINGVCDVVEFHKDITGVELFGREGRYLPYPVEYKRGKPKDSDIDILQLTAQAMCIEEMLCFNVKTGYLYYGEIRHRQEVSITSEYRNKVRAVVEEMHMYYNRQYTPKVKLTKKCNLCSLKDLCIPSLGRVRSVDNYIKNMIEEDCH